jgi:hypothetical protein
MREELVRLISDNHYTGEEAEITVEAVNRGFDAGEDIDRCYVNIEESFPDREQFMDEDGDSRSIAFHTRDGYVAFVNNLLEAGAAAFDYDPRATVATLESFDAPVSSIVNNFFEQPPGTELPEVVWNALDKLFKRELLALRAEAVGLKPLWLTDRSAAKLSELLGEELAVGAVDDNELVYRPLETPEPEVATDGVTEWPLDLDPDGDVGAAGVPEDKRVTITFNATPRYDNSWSPGDRYDPLS